MWIVTNDDLKLMYDKYSSGEITDCGVRVGVRKNQMLVNKVSEKEMKW